MVLTSLVYITSVINLHGTLIWVSSSENEERKTIIMIKFKRHKRRFLVKSETSWRKRPSLLFIRPRSAPFRTGCDAVYLSWLHARWPCRSDHSRLSLNGFRSARGRLHVSGRRQASWRHSLRVNTLHDPIIYQKMKSVLIVYSGGDLGPPLTMNQWIIIINY